MGLYDKIKKIWGESLREILLRCINMLLPLLTIVAVYGELTMCDKHSHRCHCWTTIPLFCFFNRWGYWGKRWPHALYSSLPWAQCTCLDGYVYVSLNFTNESWTLSKESRCVIRERQTSHIFQMYFDTKGLLLSKMTSCFPFVSIFCHQYVCFQPAIVKSTVLTD